MKILTPLSATACFLASVSKPSYVDAQHSLKDSCLATATSDPSSFLFTTTKECDDGMKHYEGLFQNAMAQPSQNATLSFLYITAEALCDTFTSESSDNPEGGTKFGVPYFARDVKCDMLDNPNFIEPWKNLVAPVLSAIASSLTNPNNAQRVPSQLRMECTGTMDMNKFSAADCHLV